MGKTGRTSYIGEEMTEDQYSLENLEKTFHEHAIQVKDDMSKQVKDFMENNPGEKLPPHFLNFFCLATALHVIVKEIRKIKP